jgi:hypothetical protein
LSDTRTWRIGQDQIGPVALRPGTFVPWGRGAGFQFDRDPVRCEVHSGELKRAALRTLTTQGQRHNATEAFSGSVKHLACARIRVVDASRRVLVLYGGVPHQPCRGTWGEELSAGKRGPGAGPRHPDPAPGREWWRSTGYEPKRGCSSACAVSEVMARPCRRKRGISEQLDEALPRNGNAWKTWLDS